MRVITATMLLYFAGFLSISAQSDNTLKLLSSEEAGNNQMRVNVDLSHLDAQALEELEAAKASILAKYPSIKSIEINSATHQANAVVQKGEIRGDDVVNVMQTRITNEADRALRVRYKEEVRELKSNQR